MTDAEQERMPSICKPWMGKGKEMKMDVLIGLIY